MSSGSSKRHSILPPTATLPRAPVRFPAPPQTLTVAESAILTGSPANPITLAADCVVHPRARLDSAVGPITVGRRCIMSERCVVGAAPSGDDGGGSGGGGSGGRARRTAGAESSGAGRDEEDEDDDEAGEMRGDGGVTLGEYVRVEVGAVVEAGGTLVGDGCVLGVGVRVGRGAVLGKVSLTRRPHPQCPTPRP